MDTEVDIEFVVDLANGWTANSQTRYIATTISFLCELREERIVNVKRMSYETDVFGHLHQECWWERFRDVSRCICARASIGPFHHDHASS
jgi:hypothetical protein